MSFLKRIAEFFAAGGVSDEKGIYIYVKLKRSGEIVQLRLNRSYELSRDDSGHLYSRKTITGSRSFEQAHGTFYFDNNYRFLDAELEGAELVDREDYLEQQEPKAPE